MQPALRPTRHFLGCSEPWMQADLKVKVRRMSIAIPAFGAYYFLRNRAAKVLHDIQDTMNGLLRKMPYDQLQGAHIGDEELYAAQPNWIAAPGTAADING